MHKQSDAIRTGIVPAPKPRKIRAGAAARSIAGRMLHPKHVVTAVKLQRGRKANKRVYDDAQLALLSQIIPGGYLHYGYFDDPDRCPREISLAEITRAQQRYAELLVDLADERHGPALDVGCGMGTMSRLLRDRGFAPTALTPDRFQASHIRTAHPDIPLIQCKFEDLPHPDEHAGSYGTVFTSESLQYLKLDRALPLLAKILKPGGAWVACDYFRIGAGHEKSGHRWETFRERLAETGWAIDYERDITPHILPTLRAAHMWATQFGMPLLKFVELKLRVKQPALHYVLQGVFKQLDGVIHDNVKTIDPVVFAGHKRYMLLRMRRRA